MKIYEFDALIRQHSNMNSAFVDFPYDVEQEFGTKGQVKVVATFDGYEYRGSLAKMGEPCYRLILPKEIRAAIGKNPGDTVHVVLKQDEQPRVVAIPDDFGRLLDQHPDLKVFFHGLSYTHQKEYVRWIIEAKKQETGQAAAESDRDVARES